MLEFRKKQKRGKLPSRNSECRNQALHDWLICKLTKLSQSTKMIKNIDAVLAICGCMVNLESNITPRSCTISHGLMTTDPSLRLISSLHNFAILDLEPNQITSVLPGFR